MQAIKYENRTRQGGPGTEINNKTEKGLRLGDKATFNGQKKLTYKKGLPF